MLDQDQPVRSGENGRKVHDGGQLFGAIVRVERRHAVVVDRGVDGGIT